MFAFNTINKIKKIERNFNPPYINDETVFKSFKEEGYAIIRNIIKEKELNDAYTMFENIKNDKEYNVYEKFESSGNFNSRKLQQQIFTFIKSFMQKTAHRYANLDNCEIGDGGAFFIKPNTSKSKLEPHQDSPVIDETINYAIFVWIPLQDINTENGALYILPKSHLWGNCYRSQHIPWAYGNLCKELWKFMLPVYLNKGDILLFDPSIIHASEVNNSNDYRVVICGALLPINHQKVDFIQYKDKIHKYYVNDNYWLDGGLKDSLKNFKFETINNAYPKTIKYSMIKHLL